jgi:hypothetical protein
MPSNSRGRRHDTADTSELPDIQTDQDADEDNDVNASKDAHGGSEIGLQGGINLIWACAEHAVQSDHMRTRLYPHRVIGKVRDRLDRALSLASVTERHQMLQNPYHLAAYVSLHVDERVVSETMCTST